MKYYRVMNETEAVKLALGKNIVGRSTTDRCNGDGLDGVCFFGETVKDDIDGEGIKEYNTEYYYENCYLYNIGGIQDAILVEFECADDGLTLFSEKSCMYNKEHYLDVYTRPSYNKSEMRPIRFKLVQYGYDPIVNQMDYKVKWHRFNYKNVDNIFNTIESLVNISNGGLEELFEREGI